MRGHSPSFTLVLRRYVLLSLALSIICGLSETSGVLAAEGERMPSLAKGVFLVASPNLGDPNFRQTVVLLCEYGPEGSLGVILNRPTDILLSEALPHLSVLKGTSYRVFWGGPVQPTGILMLFRVAQLPSGTRPVIEGIYLGGNLEALDRVITHPEPTETFRAFAGYAGWAPGQLEFEMSLGSWAVVAANSMTIFDKEPVQLWQDLVEGLTRPRVISSDYRSVSPSLPPTAAGAIAPTPSGMDFGAQSAQSSR
jgi:putative transcriptional regulator